MEALIIALVACVIAIVTTAIILIIYADFFENVLCVIWCFWRFITGRKV